MPTALCKGRHETTREKKKLCTPVYNKWGRKGVQVNAIAATQKGMPNKTQAGDDEVANASSSPVTRFRFGNVIGCRKLDRGEQRLLENSGNKNN